MNECVLDLLRLDIARRKKKTEISEFERCGQLDPERLIAAALASWSSSLRAAFNALSNVRNPAIRQLALEFLPIPDRTQLAIHLLERNYVDGDHRRIEQILAASTNVNEYHWLGYGALAVFKANPSSAAAAALLTLYNHGPCSTCREHCFELLHRIGMLPDWMLRESMYDANFDLRAKAREIESANETQREA